VDGEDAAIHLDSLTYFLPRPANGVGDAAENFDFAGADVSLRGTFPEGFKGNWHLLIGKSIPISPRGLRPQPGESFINLPDRGKVKVTGGKFVLSSADRNVLERKRLEPQLVGTIELQVEGQDKPETIRGGFRTYSKSEK